MLPITKSNRPRIVIVGGGFSGIELAKKLKNQPVDILMLDRHNYHTFQPLLYQVATGELEAEKFQFPFAAFSMGRKTFN